jgi:hypothetical protein
MIRLKTIAKFEEKLEEIGLNIHQADLREENLYLCIDGKNFRIGITFKYKNERIEYELHCFDNEREKAKEIVDQLINTILSEPGHRLNSVTHSNYIKEITYCLEERK